MLNSNEINNVKFSRSMGGYKQEEVDIFLDKIEADYHQFEKMIKEYQARIETYEKEIKEYKEAQNSLQNVLLSAQGLADRIVNEAKVKSEEIIRNAESNINLITERERELSSAFELKAEERKNALETELTAMINAAQAKADSITAAANDSVARQQMLFDKLKLEVAAFKTAITNKYREHLEVLNKIPDSVPNDPKYLAEIVSATFDSAPAAEEFISKSTNEVSAEAKVEEIVTETETETEDSEGFEVAEIKED